VPVTEVPRWLSLRGGDRAARSTRRLRAGDTGLGARHAHDEGQGDGRGLDHFRSEGAKLVPPPTADDPYEDEAYRLWALKQQGR